MSSALEFHTHTNTSPSSQVRKTLPSFDDLLRSLDKTRDAQDLLPPRHHPHPHLHPYASSSPHTWPHDLARRPYSRSPEHRHLEHHQGSYPLHSPHHVRRPPSTPPTPSSLSGHSTPRLAFANIRGINNSSKATSFTDDSISIHTRPRASSAPVVSRTDLSSPFGSPHLLPVTQAEHYADRVSALKDGDGEWNYWSLDAVAPAVLPYHARPHYHPRASTGTVTLTHNPVHSPLHADTPPPPPLPVHAAPLPILSSSVHSRTPSLGSRSPLRSIAPLTPQSVKELDLQLS